MERLEFLVQALVDFLVALGRGAVRARDWVIDAARKGFRLARSGLPAFKLALAFVAMVGAIGFFVYSMVPPEKPASPPTKSVGPGEIGVRTDLVTGEVTEWREGNVVVIPGVHELRVFSIRDRTYRPEQIRQAIGPSAMQSIDGLSIGVDLSFRYALDLDMLKVMTKTYPEDIAGEIVEPSVLGVIHKVFARYTVREIFSSKRAEIQQAIEEELADKLAVNGIVLRDMRMGKVDLPADYRRAMEAMLAEELATEKMRYTLELKDKRVKETELEGEAQKARREKIAEAAAREQVIAAQAQEEAMKHVLPFKERQIEQRTLEAEADKAARLKNAEASAEARRIEANGEADARRQLAEAEAYRVELVGKANADRMGREGAAISQHPLLIQKALADKLSDKIQVIIAPPPTDGSFLAGAILGGQSAGAVLGSQPKGQP
jgi:regulator of protease activity HflC (stomatin/prohibitin superfamily)